MKLSANEQNCNFHFYYKITDKRNIDRVKINKIILTRQLVRSSQYQKILRQIDIAPRGILKLQRVWFYCGRMN